MREPGSDDDLDDVGVSAAAADPPTFGDREVMLSLRAPIPAEDVLSRQGKAGRTERFIKEWAVRKRLDMAAGHENWETETEVLFKTNDDWPVLLVRCRLKVRLPSGRLVSRDGLGASPEQRKDRDGHPVAGAMGLSDSLKAGATDAFKKAGALFGIGGTLEDPADDGSYQGPPPRQREAAPPRQEHRGSWGNSAGPRPDAAPRSGDDFDETRGQPRHDGPRQPPKTGRALFAWAADMTKRLDDGTDVVKALQALGKKHNYPDRLVDWAEDQVRHGHTWAVSKAHGGAGDGDGDAP